MTHGECVTSNRCDKLIQRAKTLRRPSLSAPMPPLSGSLYILIYLCVYLCWVAMRDVSGSYHGALLMHMCVCVHTHMYIHIHKYTSTNTYANASMYIPISPFIGQRWFPRGEFICTIKCPHPQVSFFFGSFMRSGPKCCLQQSCSVMDSNKAVPPGDAKVGGQGKGTRWGCRMKQKWLQEPIGGTRQSI